MAETTVGATVQELKLAIPDSDAAFREDCQLAGLSIADAKDRWMDKLRAALVQERSKQAAVAARYATGGNPVIASGGGLGSGRAGDGDARAAWDDAIAEHRDKHPNATPDQAASAVNRANPALRQAMLAEHNAKHGRPVPATA